MQVQTSIASSQVAQSSVVLGRHDQEFSLRKQKLINQVAQIDLGPIKFKLVHEDGMDVASLNLMEDLYRKYLVMTQLFPDQTIVPTKFIDTMWHAHILDTAKYRADCQSALGAFLDHFPYLGLRGEEDAVRLATSFSNTQDLFFEVFGVKISGESSGCEATECGGTACGSSNCDSSQVYERPTLR